MKNYLCRNIDCSWARQSERGGIVLIVVSSVAVIVTLVGFTAFAVDFGWLFVSKNEAQRAVDAAALSGAAGVPYFNNNLGSSQRRDKGETLAALFDGSGGLDDTNAVMKGDPDVATATLEFISYDKDTGVVTPVESASPPVQADGVRVTKTYTAPLFFGRVYGQTSTPITVSAVAVVGAPACFPIRFPITLIHSPTQNLMDGSLCDQVIQIRFRPSPSDNGAWWACPKPSDSADACNLGNPVNARNCMKRVRGEIPPDTTCIGETIALGNGQMDSCRREIADYHCNGGTNCSEATGAWPYVLPIIDQADLPTGNAVQIAPIIGFVNVRLVSVEMSNISQSVDLQIICDEMMVGAPSGGSFSGLYGPPVLVEDG